MRKEANSDILEAIIAASSDASWCMEFGRPVDLTVSDNEIVRQIFENDPFWRLTNPAMERLYMLPPGMDFTKRHPSEIFPRSPQNEQYVLNLIANGFEVDAAPAIDRRYDGKSIYVENDARAHIRDGKLIRMFGIVRDVGKHRRREEHIRTMLDNQIDILTALPIGVLATGSEGEVTALNPTAERLLKVNAADVAGHRLASLVFAPDRLIEMVEQVISGAGPRDVEVDGLRWSIAPRLDDGIVASIQPVTGIEVAA